MTHAERLHAVVDRIADADARIAVARAGRQAAVDELHALLNEQPGQVTADGPAAGTRHDARAPAPVSQPEAGGAHSAVVPPAGSPCPGCDFSGRTATGLAVHRRRAHGVIGTHTQKRAATLPAVSNGQVSGVTTHAHPSRSEKYLCATCSQPFLSRIDRDAHQAEQSCAPIPTRPPMGPAPLGRLSGFGE